MLSTENPYAFSLTRDTAIYARFKKVEIPQPVHYDFILIPPTEIVGSVSSKPDPGRLEERTTITVTATPKRGFVFEKWTNGLNETLSIQNPYSFILDETNALIYANFKSAEIDTGVEDIHTGSPIVVMDMAGRILSTNESKDDYIRMPLSEKQIYIVKVTYLKTDWIFKVIG